MLTACGSAPRKPDPPPPVKPGGYYQDDGPGATPPADLDAIPDAIPRAEPLHRGANKPYTVFGKSYVPNVSGEPFRQTGIASWYGRKFHGNPTSIGEPYDMYGMTAAHPTLPLPSYVRVTNPANQRAVVVRVNDRGPFHADRIIDLSWTAAAKLGIAQKGSGLVVVERVFAGQPVPAPAPAQPIPTVVAVSPVVAEAGKVYLQLAAFPTQEAAEIFRARMLRELDWNREPIQLVQKDTLYRVRMGPYSGREEAEAVAAMVRRSHDFSPVVQNP